MLIKHIDMTFFIVFLKETFFKVSWVQILISIIQLKL